MKRERLIHVLLGASAAAVLVGALLFVWFGPTNETWLTHDAEWAERTIEIYTENLHVEKLAKVGDRQTGRKTAAEVLGLRRSTRAELGVAPGDERPVVWIRLRVTARTWRGRTYTSVGGELIPGGLFYFYGPDTTYKIDGWVMKVE